MSECTFSLRRAPHTIPYRAEARDGPTHFDGVINGYELKPQIRHVAHTERAAQQEFLVCWFLVCWLLVC